MHANDLIPLVGVNPDPGKLPGGPQIQTLLDGLGGWALLASLAGLLISSMAWALGSFGGNYHAVSRGKTGVLVCAACALIAGAAAPIINFFATLGSQVQ
ncbi:hypothetical protein SAMN04487968_11729 [Nocardioides terrae]|uniref:TrbC/VIRB2 family protein n=1 Tax=Nocardioides terrae TaxID=574651 RepID=A0A1I1NHJ6_9ACTN|nr:DUF6112 family protein [Nocardioides terrae]SFC97109.1 hypothetical protein SAMN04487968_11729 [Nocardioides terrae]